MGAEAQQYVAKPQHRTSEGRPKPLHRPAPSSKLHVLTTKGGNFPKVGLLDASLRPCGRQHAAGRRPSSQSVPMRGQDAKVRSEWPSRKIVKSTFSYIYIYVVLKHKANQPVQSMNTAVGMTFMPFIRLAVVIIAMSCNTSLHLAFTAGTPPEGQLQAGSTAGFGS